MRWRAGPRGGWRASTQAAVRGSWAGAAAAVAGIARATAAVGAIGSSTSGPPIISAVARAAGLGQQRVEHAADDVLELVDGVADDAAEGARQR